VQGLCANIQLSRVNTNCQLSNVKISLWGLDLTWTNSVKIGQIKENQKEK